MIDSMVAITPDPQARRELSELDELPLSNQRAGRWAHREDHRSENHATSADSADDRWRSLLVFDQPRYVVEIDSEAGGSSQTRQPCDGVGFQTHALLIPGGLQRNDVRIGHNPTLQRPDTPLRARLSHDQARTSQCVPTTGLSVVMTAPVPTGSMTMPVACGEVVEGPPASMYGRFGTLFTGG